MALKLSKEEWEVSEGIPSLRARFGRMAIRIAELERVIDDVVRTAEADGMGEWRPFKKLRRVRDSKK